MHTAATPAALHQQLHLLIPSAIKLTHQFTINCTHSINTVPQPLCSSTSASRSSVTTIISLKPSALHISEQHNPLSDTARNNNSGLKSILPSPISHQHHYSSLTAHPSLNFKVKQPTPFRSLNSIETQLPLLHLCLNFGS